MRWSSVVDDLDRERLPDELTGLGQGELDGLAALEAVALGPALALDEHVTGGDETLCLGARLDPGDACDPDVEPAACGRVRDV